MRQQSQPLVRNNVGPFSKQQLAMQSLCILYFAPAMKGLLLLTCSKDKISICKNVEVYLCRESKQASCLQPVPPAL